MGPRAPRFHAPVRSRYHEPPGGGTNEVRVRDTRSGLVLLDGEPHLGDHQRIRQEELPPEDRFGHSGRGQFYSALVDPAYDAHCRALPSAPADGLDPIGVAFSTMDVSADGVWLLRHDLVTEHIESQAPPYEIEDIVGAKMVSLDTHPEFGIVDHLDEDHAPTNHATNFINQNDFGANTFPLDLFTLPDVSAPGGERWILAVPCWRSCFDDRDLDVYDDPDHEDWQPEPGTEAYDHFDELLVQFFDVTDPFSLEEGTYPDGRERFSVPTPFEKIYGPVGGVALDVEVVDLGSFGLGVYAFVGDFASRVLVYEVTDLLSGAVPPLVATWEAPLAMTDTFPNASGSSPSTRRPGPSARTSTRRSTSTRPSSAPGCRCCASIRRSRPGAGLRRSPSCRRRAARTGS